MYSVYFIFILFQVSSFLAEHLFVNGMKSNYVHLFIAELHFPHRQKLDTYKVLVYFLRISKFKNLNEYFQ